MLTVSFTTWAREPAIWVYNTSMETEVLTNGENDTRAIASISKLMTAMVSLDYNSNIYAAIPMVNGKKTKWLTRHDLMAAMLIRSDNQAAEAIAADYPGGRAAFISAMNLKAQQLGINHTAFNDPSGLSHSNVSTAAEVGRMVAAASRYTVIRQLSHQKQMLIKSKYHKRTRNVLLTNTNTQILKEFDSIEVSKTGFTSAAGYCVAMLAKTNDQEFVVVVLGANHKNNRQRAVNNIMRNYVLVAS